MNLWEMDPAVYRNAYIHVAKLARSLAPNVALVWSPNYVGYWGSDIADYYPGDTYVDWVGVSLYMNSPLLGQTTTALALVFGTAIRDCVLSARNIADIARRILCRERH